MTLVKQRGIFGDIGGAISGLLGSADPISDIASEVWSAITSHMGDLVTQLFGGWLQDIVNQAASYMPAINGIIQLPDRISTFLSETLPNLLNSLYEDIAITITDAFVAAFAIVGTAVNALTDAVDYVDHQVKVVNQAIELCTSLANTLRNAISAYAINLGKITSAIAQFDVYLANFSATITIKFGSAIVGGVIQDITTYSTQRLNQITGRILTGIKIADYVDMQIVGAFQRPTVGYDFASVTDEVDRCYDRKDLRDQTKRAIQQCTLAINNAPKPGLVLQSLADIVTQAENAVNKYNSSKTYVYVCYAVIISYVLFMFIKCLWSR